MLRETIMLAALAAVAGCGGANVDTYPSPQVASSPPATAVAATSGATSPTDPYAGCPMALPGTSATVQDTENGVAVVFTGPASETAALRSRVYWLTTQHSQMQNMYGGPGMAMMQGCPCMGGQCGMMHGPGMMMHPGMTSGGTPMPVVFSYAAAVDVPNGAQLVLTARNPADVASLRSDVRARVGQMQSGQCPML